MAVVNMVMAVMIMMTTIDENRDRDAIISFILFPATLGTGI